VHHIGWFDMGLICLFMIGLYTGFTIQVSATVPFPSVPAGVAGMILLWRRRNQTTKAGFTGFLVVMALYVASVLSATDIRFLPRRVNGLIQLTYSIVIGYALFLTVIQASRHQIARLFLVLSLVIVAGCLLEQYAGFRPVSDAVRKVLYSQGIYENDARDLLFYNRVRPKFFASEPSVVTLCYTLFTFLWMVVSPWRWKLVAYVALVIVGFLAMPGPTLLLLLLLLLPYMLFLASRNAGRLNFQRLLIMTFIATVFAGVSVPLAKVMFPARLAEIAAGNDPSFFYRVQGPALAAFHVFDLYPFAGAGLTGEPFVEKEVTQVYVRSPSYSAGWKAVSPATELIINYFWLHWTYLGLVWGSVMIVAVMVWLRQLGVPSVAFCLAVWTIMGQAAGAYVGPCCWAVLFLSGAAAILHQRTDLPSARAGARHSIRHLRPSMSLSINPRPSSKIRPNGAG
jgi:hypothetical protein